MGIFNIFKKDSELPEPKKPRIKKDEPLDDLIKEEMNTLERDEGSQQNPELEEIKKAFSSVEKDSTNQMALNENEETLEEETNQASMEMDYQEVKDQLSGKEEGIEDISLTPEELELENLSSYYSTNFPNSFYEYGSALYLSQDQPAFSFRNEVIQREKTPTSSGITKKEFDEKTILQKLLKKYYNELKKTKDLDLKYFKGTEILDRLALIMKLEEDLKKKERVLERKEVQLKKKEEKIEKMLNQNKEVLRKIKDEKRKLREIAKRASEVKKKEEMLNKWEIELTKKEEKLVMMMRSLNILKRMLDKEEKELEEEKKMLEQNMFKKLLEHELKSIFEESSLTLDTNQTNIQDLVKKYPTYPIFQKILMAFEKLEEGNYNDALKLYNEATELYEKNNYPLNTKKHIKTFLKKLYIDINLVLLNE